MKQIDEPSGRSALNTKEHIGKARHMLNLLLRSPVRALQYVNERSTSNIAPPPGAKHPPSSWTKAEYVAGDQNLRNRLV